MLRIAVLGSTRGTDLQALLDAQANGEFSNAEITCVVSNRKKAYILERAQQAGVEAIAIPSKDEAGNNLPREQFEADLLETLQQRNVNFILLIGFMRILSADFVKHFPNQILNIHPSLLPKYAGGMNNDVHAQVLANNETETGCTLHYVTADVDEGPIFSQKAVPVLPDDTVETVKERVQKAEQELLVEAVHKISEA